MITGHRYCRTLGSEYCLSSHLDSSDVVPKKIDEVGGVRSMKRKGRHLAGPALPTIYVGLNWRGL